MPRKHSTTTFDGQGNVVELQEWPYTPEEELEADQAQEFNDYHIVILAALQNWATLPGVQKDVLLRNLLRWALWKDGRLPLGA
ncbi:hypothetical protein LCGC14_1290040 [marine sediment metagenome]|uniref:Uncharacterized protein n=1 Tax=marine sediment metagenome TaxID=412755 RepID=A0A0F9NVP6_9ZZZZ